MRCSCPERGFSLVEVLICLVIFALALVPIINLFSESHRVGHSAHRMMEASLSAQTLLEAVGQLDVSELPAVPASSEVVLLEDGGPPTGATAGRWPQVAAYFARPLPFEMRRRVLAQRLPGGPLQVRVEVEWLATPGEPRTRQHQVLQSFASMRVWE